MVLLELVFFRHSESLSYVNYDVHCFHPKKTVHPHSTKDDGDGKSSGVVFFYGIIPNVGFCAHVSALALQQRFVGWVRNRLVGDRVDMVVQGPCAKVKAFVGQCKKGGGFQIAKEKRKEQGCGKFKAFSILQPI